MSEPVNETEPMLTIWVSPEPTSDEAEVLAAVIAIALNAGHAVEPEPAPAISRWGAAGRRVAIRGLGGGPNQGWGRGRGGWT